MNKRVIDYYSSMVSHIRNSETCFYKYFEIERSYPDLYEKMGQFNSVLARHERKIVAVYSDKSFEAYAAIYSIILSNNIWLPLSQDIPPDRNRNIIESASPALCFYEGDLPEEIRLVLKEQDTEVISFDDVVSSPVNVDFEFSDFNKDDVAYIMFTSGSTGVPKGVPMTHENYINFVENALDILPFRNQEVFADFHDFAFDISIFYLFCVLFVDGIISPIIEQKDKIIPLKHIIENGITVWASVPSVLSRIMQLFSGKDIETSINIMFLCGEPFKLDVLDFCFHRMGLRHVYNFYGLTETGVENFYHKCSPSDSEKYKKFGMVPIGKSLPGNEVVISDDKELLISGCQVTPGYLGGVMKEKFVEIEDVSWFKSGDIVEVYDERFFCKGRMDSQVKISGHRIDLMDIEANLVGYFEGIEQAVCVVKESKGKQLIVANLVCSRKMEAGLIKKALLDHIPKYMVPSIIRYVEEFPVNNNGKIDRRKISENTYLE
jgi:acyl-coenzyme A synthetase/AMP-(fatty) acid ligase